MNLPHTSDRASKPKTIFFSYGHDDNRRIVERLKKDLEARGHQVWIDYDRIRTGDDWRGRITEGINTSDLALAFLSIHSVRNPGVCRNEIAMALQKFGKVYSLLLEKLDPDTHEIPLSLKHLQWADLSNWKENDEGDAFDAYYEKKLTEVISVIEGDATMYQEQIAYLAKVLRPVSFEGRFVQYLEGFTGREWLFSKYDEWYRDRPESRLFWLSAGPGFGKSALAVNLAARHPDRVIALWMCENGNRISSDPRRALTTMAYQLAQHFPDYRSKLLEMLARETGSDAESLLDWEGAGREEKEDSGGGTSEPQKGVSQPPSGDSDEDDEEEADQEKSCGTDRVASLLATKNMKELFALLFTESMFGMIPGRHRHVILIDALDEVTGSDGGNPIAALINDHLHGLPSWLSVAVTSRPDPSVMDLLGKFRPIEIKPSDENNLEDLAAYCRAAMERMEPLFRSEVSDPEELIRSLVERSGGMILYLQRIIEGISQGIIRPGDLDALGSGIPGLESYYLRDFQHRFQDGFQSTVQPLIRLLIAAAGEMSEDFASGVLGDREEVRRAKIRLGSYLGGEGRGLQFAHKTVPDWLAGERSSVFYTDREKGRGQIAAFLWKCFEQRDQDAEDRKIRMRCEKEVLDMLPGLMPLLPQWRSAKDLRALGEFLNLRKSFRASVEVSGRAYRMRKREKGADHAYTLRAQRVYGRALKGSGEPRKAVPILCEIYEKRCSNKKLGKNHPNTLGVMMDLAEALKESGQKQEAMELMKERFVILSAHAGPLDPRTLRAGNTLAVLLRDSGLLADAKEISQRLIAEMTEGLEADDARLLAMKSLLGNLEEKEGNLGAAEALYREVLGARMAKSPLAPTTQLSLTRLGECLAKQKDYAGAVSYLRKAWEIEIAKSSQKGEADWMPERKSLLNNLTVALNRSGARSQALDLLRSHLSAFIGGQDYLTYNLACYECLEGNRDRAKELIREVLKILPGKKDQALTDPDLAEIREFIASIPTPAAINPDPR